MHGITVNEPLAGTRPIAAVATAVIGIVGTAPAAPNDDYPLDKPILITDVRAALATIGATGTLPKALEAIALQCSPIIILVRVAPGADDAATETAIAGDVGTSACAPEFSAFLASTPKPSSPSSSPWRRSCAASSTRAATPRTPLPRPSSIGGNSAIAS